MVSFPYFDTLSRSDVERVEVRRHTLADYFFPEVSFIKGLVVPELVAPQDLQPYRGHSLQFAHGQQLYFANQPVRELLFPNPSDGAAYGSLLFTETLGVHELPNLRVLVVDGELWWMS